MSLLTNGPHTVQVWVEEEVTDSRGNTVRRPRADSPVTVAGCHVQPVSSSRGAFPALDVTQGQRVDATHRLICKNAPVGWWSRVCWTYRGATKTFAVLGGPLLYVDSTKTEHLSVSLQEER